MDSRVDLHDSVPSNSSSFKVKTLKMIAAASLKIRFYENHRPHQNWSLPDSIIYYITKNPSTSKCYQKMIKSCKYFFVTNPSLVINHLQYGYGFGKEKWTTSFGRKSFALDLDNIGCKLWITESVGIHNKSNASGMENLVSSIIPKIYRCDAKCLAFNCQNFSYNDYCLLSSYTEQIQFHNVTIKNADGSITSLEKLIEAAPKLKNANFSSDTILSNITSNTFQELVKLPNFSKLHYLRLNSIPETFNLDAFFTYMKANELTSFNFTFADTLSDGYKKRLEKIIDEILEAEEINFMPPFIDYVGINAEKFEKLLQIHYAH